MGFGAFFGVRDAAATRGQYLALSKAWISCFYFSSLEYYSPCHFVFSSCCAMLRMPWNGKYMHIYVLPFLFIHQTATGNMGIFF